MSVSFTCPVLVPLVKSSVNNELREREKRRLNVTNDRLMALRSWPVDDYRDNE